jgi:hypothetical protein
MVRELGRQATKTVNLEKLLSRMIGALITGYAAMCYTLFLENIPDIGLSYRDKELNCKVSS